MRAKYYWMVAMTPRCTAARHVELLQMIRSCYYFVITQTCMTMLFSLWLLAARMFATLHNSDSLSHLRRNIWDFTEDFPPPRGHNGCFQLPWEHVCLPDVTFHFS